MLDSFNQGLTHIYPHIPTNAFPYMHLYTLAYALILSHLYLQSRKLPSKIELELEEERRRERELVEERKQREEEQTKLLEEQRKLMEAMEAERKVCIIRLLYVVYSNFTSSKCLFDFM